MRVRSQLVVQPDRAGLRRRSQLKETNRQPRLPTARMHSPRLKPGRSLGWHLLTAGPLSAQCCLQRTFLSTLAAAQHLNHCQQRSLMRRGRLPARSMQWQQ